MFIQGFWFSSKLVRDDKIGAGDVMTVLGFSYRDWYTTDDN